MKKQEIYQNLDLAINGLIGMALLTGDTIVLEKYIKQASEALDALHKTLKLKD